jgi:hypothetical protein
LRPDAPAAACNPPIIVGTRLERRRSIPHLVGQKRRQSALARVPFLAHLRLDRQSGIGRRTRMLRAVADGGFALGLEQIAGNLIVAIGTPPPLRRSHRIHSPDFLPLRFRFRNIGVNGINELPILVYTGLLPKHVKLKQAILNLDQQSAFFECKHRESPLDYPR